MVNTVPEFVPGDVLVTAMYGAGMLESTYRK